MRLYFSTAFSGLLAAITFLCYSNAVAGLTWAETSKSLIVESGTASTAFGFRNDGPNEVQIAAVKSSCDCVTASSSVKSLAPGQTAEITTIFRGENHLGREDKTIAVVSVSGTDQKVDLLKLHIEIQPNIVIDPSPVTWAKGESPQAKMVWVRSSGAKHEAVTIKAIKGGESDFKVSLNAAPVAREGDAWFTISPVSTATPKRSLIRITVQNGGRTSRQIITFAIVRPD